MQCLIIDDDLFTIEVLSGFINWELFGIDHIESANNITDAKSIIEMNNPELIICDIEMPKGTGIDLIKWVREKSYNNAFIFFTSHEKFEYASTAITYKADAYLVKPFKKHMVEATIAKVVDAFIKKNALHEYSQYGSYWLENKGLLEKGFWSDVLLASISPQMEVIQKEIKKRNLLLNPDDHYHLILLSINKSELKEHWEDSILNYVICKLMSEILLDKLDQNNMMNDTIDGTVYTIAVIKSNEYMGDMKARCSKLVNTCKEMFHLITVTCYISGQLHLDEMSSMKKRLEKLDRENIALRGKVILEDEYQDISSTQHEQYALDKQLYNELFLKSEKAKIVNTFKKDIELLKLNNNLTSILMHSIFQDFIQIVYSYLDKNKVQAHKLFSNDISQTLYRRSQNSLLDMMKYITYITERAIDYVKDLRQSENVIEKAKKYIYDHYNDDIGREDVASSVFLTPDYLASIFKEETGSTINNFIIHYRIDVAKRLLIQSAKSISDIASETGFDSISYFSTVFKKITGDTPSAYRRS